MGKIELILPAMGEGIVEATITRWLVKPGDEVEKDDPIVEIATDKVDSELPAPESGTFLQKMYDEGEVPRVGDVLAIIDTGGEDDSGDEDVELRIKREEVQQQQEMQAQQKAEEQKRKITYTPTGEDDPVDDKHITSFILQLAKSRGISRAELQHVKGTGIDGAITKDDLQRYMTHRSVRYVERSIKKVKTTEEAEPEYVPAPDEHIEKMDRTRKLIAEHMIFSKHIAPHVTSTVEADVTDLVNWRNEQKIVYRDQHQVRLTFTPIFIEVIAHAIKKFPGINVSVLKDNIIHKTQINIGFATALNDGNLIVPVIKNADQKNLQALAASVEDLATRGRNNSLKPDEITGGTFTITNIGQFGNITGTPIINQPQVAILAIGVITKKPAVVYIDGQPTIGIRDIMVLSMSYDHRVVDGMLGGSFLKYIADSLEEYPEIKRKNQLY